MRIVLALAILPLLQPLSLCALTLPGTGDSMVLLQRLASEYQRLHPDRNVAVPPSVGSSGGIRLLLQGRAELVRVARPLHPAEAEAGLEWRQFARSPIVFVGNLPQNCLSDLSSEQVLGIFSGRLARWSQLGGCPEQKIYLARRENGDSSANILLKQIPGLSEIQNPAGKIVYTTQDTFETIVKYPYTLGYLPLSQVVGSALARFSFNGIEAGSAKLKSGDYPLQVPLALVWQAPLSDEARNFVRFLNGSRAQQLMTSFGVVPVEIEAF